MMQRLPAKEVGGQRNAVAEAVASKSDYSPTNGIRSE